jgi:23S rRNA (adenine2030-N6)-methyltransferase
MNYRHAYHAGNFADVVKHVVLALIIEHLKLKPAPFRVIDVHAGVGRYDLASREAGKTLEWRDGIGRLVGPDAAEPPPAAIATLLEPYLAVVRGCNGGTGARQADLRIYPGSPRLAHWLMRPQDALTVNELHPEDCAALRAEFAGARNVTVTELDAYAVLKARLPPPERRGVVLIDPPFEATDELERLAKGLRDALRRFAHGTYVVWYPLKLTTDLAPFYATLGGFGLADAWRVELLVRPPATALRLNGCGMVLINPPWTLREKLDLLLPFLAARLRQADGGGYLLEPLASS